MATYSFDDPNYFDALASPSARWMTELARASGMEMASVVMGEDDDATAPVAGMLQLQPGGLLPRHGHDCYRVEVLVRGSVIAEDGTVLHPGDVQTSKPGEMYGPFRAGPEGSLSVEIFSRGDGRQILWPEDQDEESLAQRRAAEATAAKLFGKSLGPIGGHG